MKYFIECLTQKRADCFGRASRREYWSYVWYMFLTVFVISVIAALASGSNSKNFADITQKFEYPNLAAGIFGVLLYFITMVTAVPSLAVTVRRLHDTGRSGWWYLLYFLPVIGWIWLLVLYLTPGEKGANIYGENPKELPAPGGMYRTDFQCFNSCLSKYAVFTGTSSMQEYWSFTVIVGELAGFAASIGGIFDLLLSTAEPKCSGLMALLVFVVLLVPCFSSTARRLRSAGCSPWWLLLDLIPVIGWIWLFVLCLMPDKDPKEGLI